MRAKSISDHNRVVRLEDWNGLDLTGVNDCSSILNAAHSQGLAAGMPIIVPTTRETGGILIGSTVTGEVPMIGVASAYNNYGVGRVGSRFKAGITNGSPVFDYSIGGGVRETRDGFHVQNISIEGISGHSGQNCIGFKFGEIGGSPGVGGLDTALSHGTLDNVTVYGLYVGCEMQGWVQTVRRFIAARCVLGFRGEHLNACDLDFAFEACNQGLVITKCYGVFIGRYIEEGSAAGKLASSTFDDCRDITMGSVYVEGTDSGATIPWIAVGETTQVIGFQIQSLIVPVNNPPNSPAPIKIHRVDGFSITARSTGALSQRAYSTSSRYSRNDKSPAPYFTTRAPSTPLRRGGQKAALDLLPNPYCEGLRFGCDDVAQLAGGVTISEETSNIRTGTSALRLTSIPGNVGGGILIRYYDDWAKRNVIMDGDGNAGEALTVGAWVWVPDLPGMQYEDTAPVWNPTMSVVRYDGAGYSAPGNAGTTALRHVVKGAWNFMHACMKGDYTTTADSIGIIFRPNTNAVDLTPGTDTPYIIVDEVHLAWGDCWEAMYEGLIQPSPAAAGSVMNGRLYMRVTQARAATMIADTAQTYRVGDTFEYTDPTAGGNAGTKLTSAGWREFGVISLT